MAKTKISEYSATANSNTDVASINIDEGCAPSGINNAIRAIMGHLKDFQSGTSNDPFTVGSSGSLTLSYGTTNGVAYLNGSKVLTTGSALVFDGTNLGLGVTPSTWRLDVKSSGTGVVTNGIRVNRSTVTSQYGVLNYENGTFNNVCVNTAGTGCFWNVVYSNDGSTVASIPMTLDASGLLAIGRTSAWDSNALLTLEKSGVASQVLNCTTNSVTLINVSNGGSSIAYTGTASNHPFALYTNGSERARIDSSGNLLVGTTSAGDGKVRISASANAYNLLKMDDTGSTGGNYIQFLNSAGGQAGSINHNGTSTVNYGSGSDYRLKENISPMSDALAKVSLLKPCTYTWKTDGSLGQGFIAHELQEIFPDAVVGEKDAVNEDGSMRIQTVDTSFLVATLTAAIQEQQSLITSLTERISALEEK